jgi:hypothetical protein
MAEATNQVRDERSLADLFNKLSRETSTLVRQEVRLARTEMAQSAAEVGRNMAAIAIGGFVLYAAFLALMFALIYLLAETMQPWLAALLVSVIVGAIGAFLVMRGYNRLKEVNLVPDRTVETLEENAEWLKQQVQ